MSVTDDLVLPPVPATVDNPGDWPDIAAELSAGTSAGTAITPEAVAAGVAGAVPLLYRADATGGWDLLRGTFADDVVDQCAHVAGSLAGATPTRVTVHLVAAVEHAGRSGVRVHLGIADSAAGVQRQFWDLTADRSAAVAAGPAATECPTCGGPLGPGDLACPHCGTDCRSLVTVPFQVTRLERY